MVNMKDVWNIDMVGRTSAERTGYATQKPEQLLSRMIESCTRVKGISAPTFFCGSGTLPAAAGNMDRKFIACDLGSLAIESTIKDWLNRKNHFKFFDLKPEGKSKIDAVVEVKERRNTFF